MFGNMTKAVLVITAVIIIESILAPKTVTGQPFSWRTFTFQGEVRDLLIHSGDIWAATGGGLFTYTIAANSFRIFNNTAGLSSNNTSSFVLDDQGRLWTGMDDGSLNVIRVDDFEIQRIPIDPNPIVINDLVFHDNTLYLALEFGISEFLIAREEVKATFRNLGSFVVNVAVQRLLIFNNRIWAATESGIATADLSSPNLQDPQFWANFTTGDGLPSNHISDFTSSGDTIFVGTGNGVARIVNGVIGSEGLSSIPINRLTNLNGVIHAASNSGVFRRTAPGNWAELMPRLRDVQALARDSDGALWAGHRKKGMFVYDDSGPEWINVFPPGPGSSSFDQMFIDRQDRLWIATGLTGNNGLNLYDGVTWEHLTTGDGLVSDNTLGIAEDREGRIWIGTPGQGAMILEKTGNSLIVTRIDTTDRRLSGAGGDPDFVVVPKIIRGPDDTMWLVNKFADNGRAIVAVTPDDEWHYFSVSPNGLVTTVINDITFDAIGRLWIANENEGLNRLDFNGTLADQSDDIWDHFTTEDGLASNRITSLTADNESGMWIGTEEGINHFIEGLQIQNIRGAIDNFITAVSVDPANNKWFGTRSGISILSFDDFTWTHLTRENSDLVGNTIRSIVFDADKGDAYIGTGSGLSIVSTPFKTVPASFDEIVVYPNPYVLDGSRTVLTIENIALHSTVIISSLSGKVIVRLTEENGDVIGTRSFWDGKDKNHNFVPSGIYFISAGVSGGGHGTQKVAVIRK